MRIIWTTLLLLVCVALGACHARPKQGSVEKGAASNAAAAQGGGAPEGAGPIRMETLAADPARPVFVMRGAPVGEGRLAFLHGMCGHALGYAQAFAFSAAEKGTLIAPQGDISCGGALSKWSSDMRALDARIVQTFEALRVPVHEAEVTLIGMSQGADRAVALVQRYPERYTRLVSIAAPTALKPGQLRSLRAAVMMAGQRDRQDLMRQSERALAASGVPVMFVMIPEARHAEMGPTPNETMALALDWLWSR